jgi:hypothetical protein
MSFSYGFGFEKLINEISFDSACMLKKRQFVGISYRQTGGVEDNIS